MSKKNICVVGAGYWGKNHIRTLHELGSLGGIVEQNEDLLDQITNQYPDAKTYLNIGEALDNKEFVGFTVATPAETHHDIAVQIIKSGKHVLVEKPIALKLDEADRMVEKAKEVGKQLMVAQVLRFFPEFAFLKQVIDEERYGRFLGLHMKRVISKPLWGSDNWFSKYEETGAAGIDLHVHDSDFVQYLFGMPDHVHSSGMTSPNGYVLYLATQYGFEGKDFTVTAQCGSISAAQFEHGYDAYFEDGTLWFNSLSGLPVTLYTPDGEKTEPAIDFPEAFEAQLGQAVDALENGTEPTILSGTSARNSLMICLKEAESVRTGKTVRV